MFGKEKQMGRWIAIAVAMGLVCASHVSAQRPPKPPKDEPLTYKMVRLSSDRGHASAINQLADGAVEVVGYLRDNSDAGSVHRAHYWMVDPTGNILQSMPLQTDPDDEGSRASDVNNCGIVIGNQWVGSHPKPLLWPDFMSAPIELPLPEGAVSGWANSINDAGIVVGSTYHPDDDPDPVVRLVAWKVDIVFDDEGTVTAMAVQEPVTLLTASQSVIWVPQVVNSGFVLANIETDPDIRAFRLELDWDADGVWELEGTRTQLFDVSNWAWAYGVNEVGSVCGRYHCPATGWHAYLMTAVTDPVVDLPGLPAMKKGGRNYSATRYEYAFALNNATRLQIIGEATRSYTQGNYQSYESAVPLRWDIDANGVRVIDLRTVTDGSPDLYSVGDINDAGWITSCTRSAGGGPESPVLLIPSK